MAKVGLSWALKGGQNLDKPGKVWSRVRGGGRNQMSISFEAGPNLFMG